MNEPRTIEETYQLDTDKLTILAEKNGYWESCAKFYLDIKNKNIEEITSNQESWLETIAESYEEEFEKHSES